MISAYDLFLMGLAQRSSRLMSQHLKTEIDLKPCQPLERFGVEVMVGLPALSSPLVLSFGEHRALVVFDAGLGHSLLDRLMGGSGHVAPEDFRAYTEIEQNLLRKVARQLLPGLTDIWQSFDESLEPLELLETDKTFSSPWNADALVVETSFSGGLKSSGVLRFFWPHALMTRLFPETQWPRENVDEWKVLPWVPGTPSTEASAAQAPAPAAAAPDTSMTERVEKIKQRIAFDDFDAMIDSLNQHNRTH